MSKVLRSIYLDKEQAEKIKKLSEETRIPQAVYVREGLDLILKKYEKELNSQRTFRYIRTKSHYVRV